MAAELGRSLPQPEERQGELPAEVLRPEVNALIESFRDKLSEAPEFKDALVDNYLYQDSRGLEQVEFQKGDYQYSVYLRDVPGVTERELKDTDLEEYVGERTLIIQRGMTEYGYNECLELYIGEDRSGRDRGEVTEVVYDNDEEDIHGVEGKQALEKAREIIDSF